MDSKFFTAEPIAEGVTQITGPGMVYCYLVEGAERALLIDTLCGIGDLAAFCKELTDLPVIVANTHSHFDHTAGNFQFEEVHIHPVDRQKMLDCSVDMCTEYVESQQKRIGKPLTWSDEDVVKIVPIRCVDIFDGFTFDLGGRIIEVVETPGHTKGSVCFLDRTHRLLFAGDCCNSNTIVFDVMGMSNPATIEEYHVSLKKLKQLQNDFDLFVISHGTPVIDKSCIDEAMICCEEIMAGTDDAEPGVFLNEHPCLYAKKRDNNNQRIDGGIANIAYTKDNIRKKNGKS